MNKAGPPRLVKCADCPEMVLTGRNGGWSILCDSCAKERRRACARRRWREKTPPKEPIPTTWEYQVVGPAWGGLSLFPYGELQALAKKGVFEEEDVIIGPNARYKAINGQLKKMEA